MGHHSKKDPQQKQTTKEKLNSIKKARKQKLKEKRARLVIRNLPFQATEENIKEHFEKYGEIEEVMILKKEDGKKVGCAFVQFKLVQKAAKARHHTNEKPFFDRDILVDFALAKNKFEKVKIKQENEVKIKEEPIDDDNKQKEQEGNTEIDEEEENEKEVEKEEMNVNEEEDKSEVSDSEDEEKSEQKVDEDISKPKPKIESHDVSEGKTVFIKNVPFTATNEDLKQCMQQFGPLFYALICVDKFTEHSKGTGFVKFTEKQDAEKALSAGTELTLFGNVLDCHPALDRNALQQKHLAKKEEKSAPKDSRNLYLVKEGVILAGNKAAEGVSATDMSKRLQLEQYKTQMLRNLNMFVSRDRLVIHNLPPSWDDNKLRTLFVKYSPKNSVIKEARVMRDLKNITPEGVGRSKEFGFVTFAKHEDALTALRSLNNNPRIFSEGKRPIVAFSIENKAMIKAKLKRLEKSKQKNPKSRHFDPSSVPKIETKKDIEGVKEKFVGVTAKPGVQHKMRSRHNLRTQAKLHLEQLKKEKKKQKFAKKSLKEKKQEFTKQPKQKINKKKNDDHFGKLVGNYKKMLKRPEVKKTKWYEEG